MKFKKRPFSPWMFPSLKIKDAYADFIEDTD